LYIIFLLTVRQFSITPWITNMGLQEAYVSCGCISLAATSVYLFMIAKGKKFRAHSSPKYRHMLGDALSKGIVH
jgi:hypothetical protein